jgi:hypothetical protein
MDVNVADSLTLTDSAAISVTPLKVDLSDSIGVTDYQLINELLSISLSDSITVVDAVSRLMQSTILDIELNEWVGGPSYATFGQQLPVRKELDWMTDVVNYDTGHEQRNQIWSRPIRRWPINWRAMDKAARDRLIELYHRSRGTCTGRFFSGIGTTIVPHRSRLIPMAWQLLTSSRSDIIPVRWNSGTRTRKTLHPDRSLLRLSTIPLTAFRQK